MAVLRSNKTGTGAMKTKPPTLNTLKNFLGCQYVHYFFVLMAICLHTPFVMALGTPPGTILSNQAVVHYIVEGDSYTRNSNVTMIRMDEVVDVSVVWQDTAPVIVNAGDTNRILTFRMTNTGNGIETLRLSVDNTTGTDAYDPSFVNMYLDTNGNGLYDAGLDELYVLTVNDPVLPADGFLPRRRDRPV